ncbi:hypothetical protein [Christiangramia echinicola]|nr:hypothetical protein [Christiangramia echinicola]
MKILMLFLILLSFGCKSDPGFLTVSNQETLDLNDFKKIESISRSTITKEDEPGEKLLLCLKYIDKENKKPLLNQEVKFYHTSDLGEYDPADPEDESTARLKGTAVTNKRGRIYIETILPGDYGSSDDNRHIHTIVKGAKPETYDIHFLQYTGFMGKRFIENSDQHFLAELKYNKDSTLVAFLTIEVKQPVLKN